MTNGRTPGRADLESGRLSKAAGILLYHLLETELGGVQVYETALRCAVNRDLHEEWSKYRDETREHVDIATRVLEAAGLDPQRDVPARALVRRKAEALVESMKRALEEGDPETAQIAACEAVVEAETKDHLNWELLGEAAKNLEGDENEALADACEQVEDEEDEHLYHTTGWARELHLQALGLDAVLPPPEEERDVKTAMEAAEAKQDREEML